MKKGASLVELLIYSGLLAVVMLVLYSFYIQVSQQRLYQLYQTSLATNGHQIMFDLQQTIKQATSVSIPAAGSSGSQLSLDGGNLVYTVDADFRLVKTEGDQDFFLTDGEVLVDQITFYRLGPSTANPTIKIELTLKAKGWANNQEQKETWQTAVTLL
ncbi:hypothetical protein COU97_02175 [Candidatus Shapirobacteria bacterium CG10_big_fil_rev_8_21_14_0_10_48_15]|uniref:Prepilin-type N-terminal cleavage/methylation domain-containing protein n=1 Tax=Candidatus Shapirobacteria bacterium CG10_big_fil_rev_8_21_14_0_10_48_15 TaxID=1974484 RepID=A0A2M8L735_9BACT|nr:MAG: hypothetical protein COU97_02175 [Candidatus Shapirobacteria bacterium CG10_big_fil_rev_8_21_14_0_10_48_15]